MWVDEPEVITAKLKDLDPEVIADKYTVLSAPWFFEIMHPKSA